NAMVVAVSAAIGPSVAAAILAVAPWPWLFAVNVPTGILALYAATELPRTRRARHRFDILSAILNALTFGILIAAIDGAGHEESLPTVLGQLGLAVLFGTILVWRQLSRPWPLLPIDLLRIPMFALSISTSICSFTAQMLAYVSIP